MIFQNHLDISCAGHAAAPGEDNPTSNVPTHCEVSGVQLLKIK